MEIDEAVDEMRGGNWPPKLQAINVVLTELARLQDIERKYEVAKKIEREQWESVERESHCAMRRKQERREPVKAWAIIDSNGRIKLATISAAYHVPWFRIGRTYQTTRKSYEDQGYRCVKVEVSVIDQKAEAANV